MLEGKAGAGKFGCDRLAELGAPLLQSVRTVGGGAKNTAWTRIGPMRPGAKMVGSGISDLKIQTNPGKQAGARNDPLVEPAIFGNKVPAAACLKLLEVAWPFQAPQTEIIIALGDAVQ